MFWRKGYEGASLAELTAAMGINRPSPYAAFGNKEALFRRALDRYMERPAAALRAALAAPTARQVAECVLADAVDRLTDPANPPGCMAVHGALACGAEAEPIRREPAARRQATERAQRERFERARAEGDLAEGVDPAGLTRYLAALVQGMAVQAVGGASSRDELAQIAAAALAGLTCEPRPAPERTAMPARPASWQGERHAGSEA